jgi:hypothetical protein
VLGSSDWPITRRRGTGDGTAVVGRAVTVSTSCRRVASPGSVSRNSRTRTGGSVTGVVALKRRLA